MPDAEPPGPPDDVDGSDDPNGRDDPDDPNGRDDPDGPNGRDDPDDPDAWDDPDDPDAWDDPDDPNGRDDPDDPDAWDGDFVFGGTVDRPAPDPTTGSGGDGERDRTSDEDGGGDGDGDEDEDGHGDDPDGTRPPAAPQRTRGTAGRLVRAVVWPLWNRHRRRLRAPWRIALGAVVFIAGTVATGLVVGASGLAAAIPLPLRGLSGSSVALAGGTAALVLVGALALDRRRVRDYGLGIDRDWAVDCAFGMALGVVLVSGIVAVEVAAGWLTLTGPADPSPSGGAAATGVDGPTAILTALGLFVLVGVYEELLARGYLLTNLAEGLAPLGTRPAVALATLASSGAFGAVHAGNPNATLVSTLSVSFAGVVLAVGYLLTGELAIPVGFHVTWNATLGVGYGLPVSGVVLPASILSSRVDGPTGLTGGSFGPEAGLLGVAALLVGVATILAYVRLRYGRVGLDPSVADPAHRWRDGPE